MSNDNYKKITLFSDTINIQVVDNGSSLVQLDPLTFKLEYRKKDTVELIGEKMLVRKELRDRLITAQTKMQQTNPEWQFLVTYGYRAPSVQAKYFNRRLEEVSQKHPELSESERTELAHSMSAHPDSAGHPTGGAIDLTIWDNTDNKELDMGSGIGEFGDIAYTLYPNLTPEQKTNRLILQQLLTFEGLAPFLGEWWHFSYGDKEWAFYYNKKNAIYEKIESNEALKSTSTIYQ